MEKKTPLYDAHVKCGGHIVPFGGFLLPVQYDTGIKKEHLAVRTECGIFDVSHMGEILVQGEKACEFLNLILTNNFSDLLPGHARYSPMCNEEGGTVDDLIVYMKAENDYLVVVNASNTEKDFNWMKEHKIDGVTIENVSEDYALIALQGPNAEKVLQSICDSRYIPSESYTCVFDAKIGDIDLMISRTGYTGEDGFEIYMAPDKAVEIWDMLIEAGSEYGLIPCGLGARDTLRIEAGMPLYGHELTDEISPRTAGLGFAIKYDKGDFIGKAALETLAPLKKRRVGLKVTSRGILREHCDVYKGEKLIGQTTSGTFLPYLEHSYAIAIIDADEYELGSSCEVVVRGRKIECEMVKLPFYKR